MSLAATGLFLLNYRRGDNGALAILLVIALLSLRGAWKLDRQIRMCDQAVRNQPKSDR